MRSTTGFRSWLLTILFGAILVCSSGAEEKASKWEKVGEVDPVKVELDANTSHYDERTAKYYRRDIRKFSMNEAITVNVASSDFAPVIQIRDASGKLIAQSAAKKAVDGNGNPIVSASLDWSPPEEGTYFVDITSDEPDQGSFIMSGAMWKVPGMDEDLGPISEFPESHAGFAREDAVSEDEVEGVKIRSTQYFLKGAKHFIEISVGWMERGGSGGKFQNEFLPSPNPGMRIEDIAAQDGNVYTRIPTARGYEGILVISETKEARAYFYVKAGPENASVKEQFLALAKAMIRDAEGRAIDKR